MAAPNPRRSAKAAPVAGGGSSCRLVLLAPTLLLLLLLPRTAHAQPQPPQQPPQQPAAAGPVTMPLTYRSQRPLADAAPLRRHKAQVIGSGATGGQFLGIDRMHFPPGGVRLEAVDFVAVVEAGTNAVKAASAAVEKLEALNPAIWAYFASLDFPGNQKMDVLVDTGSAGMGVPIAKPANWSEPSFVALDAKAAGAEIIACQDPRCRGACDQPNKYHFCSPKGGSCVTTPEGQDVCTFAWLYGDGSSASGVLLTSKVKLADLEVTTTYGAIDNASINFFEAPHGGGIMGMSFGNYALCDAEFSCFPPLLDDVVQQQGLPNKFAICHDGMQGGQMVLGGGSDNLRDGELKVAPLQPPFGFYSVGVEGIALGNQSVLPEGNTRGARLRGGQYKDEGKLSAIVDTGNSALYIPEAIYNNFKAGLLKSLGPWPELSDPNRNMFTGYAVYIPPEILKQLPPLTFTMDGGAVISLPPEQYTLEFKIPEAPVPIRALKVLKSNRFVIGQTVLSKQYIEIDRDAKTIGIAPAKPGCPV